MIKAEEYIERRNRLFKEIEDNSIVVLFSGVPKKSSSDEGYDMISNRNFYYLTGIEQENSYLVLLKSDGITKEYLFINEADELKEKWFGKRISVEYAINTSGIQNVLFSKTFMSYLPSLLENNNNIYGYFNNIYLDMDSEQKIMENTFIESFANDLKQQYPNKNFYDVYNIISNLRMIKSVNEIEEFKGAVATTNIGLKKIMKELKGGLNEYQLSSLFYYTIQNYDFSPLSFHTIAASGVNATILHYPTPLGKTKDGDLMLFDLGAKHNGYCADISRTYPINGKFNDLQKTIYSIVLGCNKMVIKEIRPGVTIKELNNKVIDYLADGCLKAGLIKEHDEIKNYYFHGVSHHIGLDTHDVGDRTKPLQAGCIISDEPGLYFKELGIGVRIEDDVLVTETGSICLSDCIIKEIDDIEKAMKYRN